MLFVWAYVRELYSAVDAPYQQFGYFARFDVYWQELGAIATANARMGIGSMATGTFPRLAHVTLVIAVFVLYKLRSTKQATTGRKLVLPTTTAFSHPLVLFVHRFDNDGSNSQLPNLV